MLVTVYIHKLCTYFPDDMLQVNGIGKTKIEEPVNSESVPCLQVRRKGIDFRQEGQTPLQASHDEICRPDESNAL